MGSVTRKTQAVILLVRISTHTLRGERDLVAVTGLSAVVPISTHTLRGERDLRIISITTCSV